MMDVSQKLDNETKTKIANLHLECQILKRLFTEKEAALQEVVKQTLNILVANPSQYGLKINPGKDIWELKLRSDALVIPGTTPVLNRAARRAIAKNN